MGDAWDIEEWLKDHSGAQLLATPLQLFDVPGAAPMLMLAVIGWPESVWLLYLLLSGEQASVEWDLELRDDRGRLHSFGSYEVVGQPNSRVVIAKFWGAVALDVAQLHLSGVPKKELGGVGREVISPPSVIIDLA